MSKIIFLKSLRELLVPLKRLIDRKAEKPNWNENDPESHSYIAGRPFYTENKEAALIKGNYSFDSNGQYLGPCNTFLKVNKTYNVLWDGVQYECKVYDDGNGYICIGNQELARVLSGWEFPYDIISDEPFFISTIEEYSGIIMFAVEGQHSCEVLGDKEIVHKISSKYLPEISSVGKSGTGDHAEIFNDYDNNTASGDYSHVEGYSTVASGYTSHAEGEQTTASGRSSHAEGDGTSAAYDCTHAEGRGSSAIGWVSHAEGYETMASGGVSHAEGYVTIAGSDNQHVQGKWNIEDTSHKYAHIVGNGEYNARSNAHTLDWNGVGWFAGGLKVGGTGQDDGNAKNIATETYVDEKITAIPTPDVSGQIAAPKNSIAFIDQVNGYTYIACMRDGNFVTYCTAKSIEVTRMPNKTEYMVGEYFDPTGMIVAAIAYDETTREITDFICPSTYITEGSTSIEIKYVEAGVINSTTIPITVSAFNASTVLVDFDYTANENGTYTITGWHETLNGEANTEMIIPNNGLIIV